MLLEDLRMSVPATVWVPLVTAGIGLLTGIGAAIGTAFLTQGRTDRREDVRWQRERDDRQEQWQREREAREEQWQHEDALRWLQNRQQAYAGLIAVLYQWDNVLSSAIAVRHNDVRFIEWTPLDRDEHRAAAKAAAELLTPGAVHGSRNRPFAGVAGY